MEVTAYPNNDLVLKRVRELVASKQHIRVPVQLPVESHTHRSSLRNPEKKKKKQQMQQS
jgi:hypothetical protein